MTTAGAIIGLMLAIWLIVRKVPAVYSLTLGALVGGVAGGVSLADTVTIMMGGIQEITPAVIRILTAGVLSGVLIKTGAAEAISDKIVETLGEKHVYLALALSVMLLCAIGVFIDVAVITVAPVALLLGQRLGISPSKLLIVMVGGGKCGNIVSPNPNTIIAADNFGSELYAVMSVNFIPALIGLLVTVYLVAKIFPDRRTGVFRPVGSVVRNPALPSFAAAVAGPLITILLLALRPLTGFAVDPLIALPAGGLAGLVCMRKWSLITESMDYGLSKMAPVAVLLIGTGTIAGVIKNSGLKDLIVNGLSAMPAGDYFIAPVSGILMSAATASTTAGAAVASSSFAQTILALGVPAVWGAALINSGATVLDHLPHGSFFHATGGAVEINFRERMKLIPYETLIGAVLSVSTIGAYYICRTFF